MCTTMHATDDGLLFSIHNSYLSVKYTVTARSEERYCGSDATSLLQERQAELVFFFTSLS